MLYEFVHRFAEGVFPPRVDGDSKIRTRMYRSGSTNGGPYTRLPLYDHHRSRSDSPDSPEYRARGGGRRAAARLAVRRFLAWLQRARFLPVLQCILGGLGLAWLVVWLFWETQIEFAFYPRSWIRGEILRTEPLAGCFAPEKMSRYYNSTEANAPKRFDIQAGLGLRLGMDCYNFAGTIRNDSPHAARPPAYTPHVYFHSYWRKDLVTFGERQAWMLRSFFATQDLTRASLILWSNDDLSQNPYIATFLRTYPRSFNIKVVDMDHLAQATALAGSPLLRRKDNKAWVDGDLVRLLVTWEYGGVWIDMDSLLTRDLGPLLEHEFVTQWDCYDKVYKPLNGALMHFFRHSPYLCEAFHVMAGSPPPRPGTTDWGSTLYLKIWRRLVESGITPFKILPFCFSDARSCRNDNRLPDPFKPDERTWGGGRSLAEGAELDDVLGKVFSVHLHNQWEKAFPKGGWVERLLLRRYERKLSGLPHKEGSRGMGGGVRAGGHG